MVRFGKNNKDAAQSNVPQFLLWEAALSSILKFDSKNFYNLVCYWAPTDKRYHVRSIDRNKEGS